MAQFYRKKFVVWDQMIDTSGSTYEAVRVPAKDCNCVCNTFSNDTIWSWEKTSDQGGGVGGPAGGGCSGSPADSVAGRTSWAGDGAVAAIEPELAVARCLLWWNNWGLRWWRWCHIISVLRACNLTSFSLCLTGPVDYLFASRHKGPRFKSPLGYLCETGILLLALSRYIGDPDVIDHHCGLVCGGPHSEPSLGLLTNNVMIPLDLTQLSCPGFTLPAGLPSGFTTDGVGCWGGALWRACKITSFSPCLTGPVGYLFASLHKGPRFKSPGGYLYETGILLLACLATSALYL